MGHGKGLQIREGARHASLKPERRKKAGRAPPLGETSLRISAAFPPGTQFFPNPAGRPQAPCHFPRSWSDAENGGRELLCG